MTIGDHSLQEENDLPEFLRRIQSGDESAARELLQRYEPEVRLVVRRQLPRLLRSRFDSLDFLQSVWGSFFRRMRDAPTDFEDSRHLVAFLARAAKNKVIDEYRRAASLKQDMHREEPLWVDGRRPKEVPDPIDSPSEVAQAQFGQGRPACRPACRAARRGRVRGCRQPVKGVQERRPSVNLLIEPHLGQHPSQSGPAKIDTPAPPGSSKSGDALKLGKTPGRVPAQVRVLRKMPERA